MNRDEQIAAYRAAMGTPATERQLALAAQRCHHCGGILPQHSPLCKHARAARRDPRPAA